jgi:hypothetical protein
MAKKQKRQVSQSVISSPSPAPAFRRTITTSPTEFTPDYSFVISDLKRIATLAASFFVVLVVLSFIVK